MNIIEIYGTANDFSGGFDDDGNHHGQTLLPCPFCGKDDALEICNTHTPVFWIECECGAERHGEYIDGAGNTSTKAEALANYTKALVSAVNNWNTRCNVVRPSVQKREQIRLEHAEWSQTTFGDVGPVGPLKHLAKEAREAAADPSDPLEWADMQFLFWDAQRRMGISDEFITRALIEKLAINKTRQWPEPKDGEPRLHIKEQPASVTQSPILHSFYIAYHEWLKNGADAASCIFERKAGLCTNAYDYFIYVGADVSGPLNEMHTAFEVAGLNRELPFNETSEHYETESKRGECHLNKARIGWVSRHAISPLYTLASAHMPPVPSDDLVRSIETVARLNNEMWRWTSCMSYDGSYVGEPEGLLKRNIREIEHILDAFLHGYKEGENVRLHQPVSGQEQRKLGRGL